MNRRFDIWAAVIFWALLLLVNLIRTYSILETEQFIRHLKVISLTYPMDMVTFCVFYFALVPRIMKKEQVGSTVLLGIGWFLGYSLVWDLAYFITGRVSTTEGLIAVYQSSLGHTLLHALYAVVLAYAVDWYRKYQMQKELEQKNAVIELAMLRSQINPHFLFNVLNNIHSTVHDNPDQTSWALIKLSGIMRYMIYESNQATVPLDKEIEHIKDFLSLQKIRSQEKESFHFEVTGNTRDIRIAPLIFISFVENAFKHGKKNMKHGIDIGIKVVGHELTFHCYNYIRRLNEIEEQQVERIGLKNIKRRLELLYPDKHQLIIVKDEECFAVTLVLNLD